MKRQVIVVGAGPSGSSSAFYLAKAGVDVLMVDKETWPRDKACGDGQAALQLHEMYKEMGILEEAEAAAYSKLPGWAFSGVKEEIATFMSPTPWLYCTPRRIIDDIIRRGALRGGADFMENFEATQLIIERGTVKGVKGLYKGKQMDIRSDAVVIAEGSHSMLARQLGIWTEDPELIFYSARGYFDNVNGMLNNAIEEHFPHPMFYPTGYMWVFPMGGKRANVGVFITETALLKSGLKLEEFFDWWRDNTKIGKERLGSARVLGKIKGWRIATSKKVEKCYASGAIVVGDSANLIECMDGGGFLQAMVSGKVGANVLANAMAKGDVSEQALSTFHAALGGALNETLRFWTAIRKYISTDPIEFDKMIAAAKKDPQYPNIAWDSFFQKYLTVTLKVDLGHEIEL